MRGCCHSGANKTMSMLANLHTRMLAWRRNCQKKQKDNNLYKVKLSKKQKDKSVHTHALLGGENFKAQM
jgi:hypothetical protein